MRLKGKRAGIDRAAETAEPFKLCEQVWGYLQLISGRQVLSRPDLVGPQTFCTQVVKALASDLLRSVDLKPIGPARRCALWLANQVALHEPHWNLAVQPCDGVHFVRQRALSLVGDFSLGCPQPSEILVTLSHTQLLIVVGQGPLSNSFKQEDHPPLIALFMSEDAFLTYRTAGW